MAKATLYLFTSLTCPHCPAAKLFAEQVRKERGDFTIAHVVSGMPGAERLFRKFDVQSVPTIIIKGPGYPHRIGLRGTQSPKTLHKYLDLALGIQKEHKPQKGFLARLFS